jgi:hypothetical protein
MHSTPRHPPCALSRLAIEIPNSTDASLASRWTSHPTQQSKRRRNRNLDKLFLLNDITCVDCPTLTAITPKGSLRNRLRQPRCTESYSEFIRRPSLAKQSPPKRPSLDSFKPTTLSKNLYCQSDRRLRIDHAEACPSSRRWTTGALLRCQLPNHQIVKNQCLAMAIGRCEGRCPRAAAEPVKLAQRTTSEESRILTLDGQSGQRVRPTFFLIRFAFRVLAKPPFAASDQVGRGGDSTARGE